MGVFRVPAYFLWLEFSSKTTSVGRDLWGGPAIPLLLHTGRSFPKPLHGHRCFGACFLGRGVSPAWGRGTALRMLSTCQGVLARWC